MSSVILRNLVKSYDGNKNVIDNINLEINDKEFIVLVGSSGCGKSTILRLVAGLINALMVLCIIWAVVVITGGSLPGLNDQALAGSRLYTFFSAYNPFS